MLALVKPIELERTIRAPIDMVLPRYPEIRFVR
jgi:hypothetical protein